MFRFILGFLLISSFGVIYCSQAKAKPEPQIEVSDMTGRNEVLPRRGDLNDILRCAGSNEFLWTTRIKEDPYSYEANEAKHKAGWYTAVAVSVFEVKSEAILEAIKSAKEVSNKTKVIEQAKQ